MATERRWAAAVVGGLVLVLAVVGLSVRENEWILANGRVLRLELAPVDPRSLLQGDYMALNYEVQNRLRGDRPRADGFLVVRPDERNVGRFVRVQADAMPLAADEMALRYRLRSGVGGFGPRGSGVRFATNAFFFEEGSGPRYEQAKFGEFRVGPNGEPRLVALLDADLNRLGENRY